jgi:hypothetical protein
LAEVIVDQDTYIDKLREQRNMHLDGEAALAGQLGAAALEIAALKTQVTELEKVIEDGKSGSKDPRASKRNGREKTSEAAATS